MRRTKESLLAQQAAKQEKGVHSFSFVKFPNAQTLRVSTLFLVLALACFALPVFLPDLGKELYRQKAVQSVSQFELTNEVFKGQFKGSVHSGDTRPNKDATFMAVSILTSTPGGRVKNEDKTHHALSQLEAKDFNKNTQDIFQGIAQLKGLGLLKGGSVSQQYTDKYFNLLLSLTERHSAFRLNTLRSASVSATYYAFQAIKELGKMDQFKKTEEFNSAVHFVASMKDTTTGGFRDATGENATLLATWHAIHVLSEKDTKSEVVVKAYEGVDKFVFHCQAKDGGFLNAPVENVQELYFSHNNMSTTSQALYVLEFLAATNKVQYSFTDPAAVAYFDAINYLRACLSLRHGVLGSYPSEETDLQATYYFLQLVNDFPGIVYGIPRSLQIFIAGLGVLFFLASVYYFYSPRIPSGGAAAELASELKTTAVFLALGAVVLQLWPSGAVLVYLAFAVHLAVQFYEVVSTDTTDGLLSLIASANVFCSVGLIFMFTYVSPLVFANVRVFYVLAAWNAVTTFAVTLTSCYMSGVKKIRFFVNASYLAWITNTVLCYAFLYGRGELAIVYRLIVVHGHFPAIFVLLPIVSLVLSFAVSAAAGVGYFQGTAEKKEKKQETAPKSPAETKRLTAGPQDASDNNADASAEGEVSKIED